MIRTESAALTEELHNRAEAIARELHAPPATEPPPWRGQSLADGAAGIALLHIERALTGAGEWAPAQRWLRTAVASPVAATDDAGLFLGLPALAFTLHAAAADGSDRYTRTISTVDKAVTVLAHRRVDAALARIHRGAPASFREYDVISGLAGIGAHLLRHTPHSDALPRVLAYLVRLTEPLRVDGESLPGWWVAHDPDLSEDVGGHANFGMAHGIAGPLALLALAYRGGVTVDRHVEAIERIHAWYDAWRRDHPNGPWWPQWITRAELRSGNLAQQGPGRPSWCYGAPGVARALQLAAIVTANTTRQQLAEQALADCLANPAQLDRLSDAGLCHGTAGLVQIARCTAADAASANLSALVPDHLLTRHEASTAHGLLDGAAGYALACRSTAHPPLSGWDACLLIA